MAFNPDCPELKNLDEFRKAAFPPHTHELLKAGSMDGVFTALDPAAGPDFGVEVRGRRTSDGVVVLDSVRRLEAGHPTPSPFPPAPSIPNQCPETPGELLRNGWRAITPERKAEIRREGAKILTNMSHAPRADVLAALERAYGLEP